MPDKRFLALGLMSGTSMDGIDAALIDSDGHGVKTVGKAVHMPYSADMRRHISQAMEQAVALGHPPRQDESLDRLAEKLTILHAHAVKKILAENGLAETEIAIIGFHGQTVLHRPDENWTWQIGDGQLLADLVRIPVVHNFRQNDMKHGGQGAPLVPIYHQALVREHSLDNFPVAIVNIGGVGNITWIGSEVEGRMLAFDTGPGNALLDDWIGRKTDLTMDRDGEISATGKVDGELLNRWLEQSYFYKMPPKSLDRHSFDISGIEPLSLEDGAATLAEFTARTIEVALKHCPEAPRNIYVCGGGRHNRTLMSKLGQLGIPVSKVEDLGWRGDYLEAEAFAFLACRHLRDLPITFPGTTGVSHSSPGGVLYKPAGDQ